MSVHEIEDMTRAYALTADENGWFLQAAAGYEAALLSNPADLEATVNLVVLYWQAAGDGSCAPGWLPAEFRSHANRRVPELLEAASQRFAGSAEVTFWKRYIGAANAGEALAPTACRQLMRERPDYLEPAFVVFAKSAGAEAEPEAMRLLADCSEQPTTRARYVTSIINAALRKQRWSSPCCCNRLACASGFHPTAGAPYGVNPEHRLNEPAPARSAAPFF